MSTPVHDQKLPLTGADRNTWYLLTTLYDDHEKNRRVWNAWVGQALSQQEKQTIAEHSDINVQELSAWTDFRESVEQAHRLAWEERNPSLSYPGLPRPGCKINLSQTAFPKDHPSNFQGMVFTRCSFQNSRFQTRLDFSHATFFQSAEFDGAEFFEGVKFHSTTFGSSVGFTNAKFLRGSLFRKTRFASKAIWVNFSNAEFGRLVDLELRGHGQEVDKGSLDTTQFLDTTFNYFTVFNDIKAYHNLEFRCTEFHHNVSFSRAIFAGRVDMYRMTFNNSVRFDNAVFERSAYFYEGTFSGAAYFGKSDFKGECTFSGDTFNHHARFGETIFRDHVGFRSVTFNGHAYFNETVFGHPESSVLCQPDFTDSAFMQPVSFRDARFRTHYPILAGTLLHERSFFSGHEELWPKMVRKKAKVARRPSGQHNQIESLTLARESCAVIRHCIAKQGLPEAAHFFFRREMRFAIRDTSFLRKIPYTLYWFLSDFGNSILRPTVGLVVVFSFFVGIFCVLQSKGVTDCPEPFAHAFLNTVSLFASVQQYFPDCSSGLRPLLSATQSILSYIMLFFVGLGLRQRFRLRA